MPDTPIHWHLPELLARKGWTAYKLAQETGLTIPAAYRLSRPGKTLSRLDLDTLARICHALKIKPGQLLTLD